jgi:hypothetical protein
MAKKGFSIPTSFLLIGGVVVAGAALLYMNPSILSGIITSYNTPPPSPTAATVPTVTSAPQPATSVVTPPLAQIEAGVITPYFQNQFCDPTLGLNWDPLQGKCVQALRSSSGNCAPGSVFNHNLCQCVPANIPQQPGYRDCASSCVDKINTVFSWCQLGCISKSAAYGNPALVACPPK